MNDALAQDEVLELLSRGKITIDEAVELLDHTQKPKQSSEEEEPVYKADIADHDDDEAMIKIDDGKIISETVDPEPVLQGKIDKQATVVDRNKQPRWLRIRVANLDNGKNKVAVNVPFAMVKFGLGVARVFTPEISGAKLEEISELFAGAEEGLLVDVEDVESNEHVQIFVD